MWEFMWVQKKVGSCIYFGEILSKNNMFVCSWHTHSELNRSGGCKILPCILLAAVPPALTLLLDCSNSRWMEKILNFSFLWTVWCLGGKIFLGKAWGEDATCEQDHGTVYGEWLNACVKYLLVDTLAFLIAQFLMCLLFSLFCHFRPLQEAGHY